MSNTSQFNASASMLGYIYQVRYGLLLAWKRLAELPDPDLVNISIEKLDDIGFDQEGTPEELLQTKFHSKTGNITDRSADIWKTIRVWVESAQAGDITLGEVILTLVTTEAIAEGSLAECLGAGKGRNIAEALDLMAEICEESNETNLKGYQAYKSLSKPQRQVLLNSIYILGKSGDLLNIRDRMTPIARQCVPAEAVGAFIDRVEGVWFGWCVEVLSKTPTGVINLGDLQDLIDEFRPEYSHTNLPPEFTDFLPEATDIESDERLFIQQLRLFKAPRKMMELAVINYYRAFEQRNKWAVDGLLNPGELDKFDRKLLEKWQEKQAYLEAIQDIATEEGKRIFSVELYQHCQDNGVVPIRRDFIEHYLSKGSYHILSDDLRIGWHPEFESLGEASNEGAA